MAGQQNETAMKKVLIVEDQEDVREVIRITLELEDFSIHEAPDGNAGLTRLMVRKLIPQVAPGHTMQDVVLAKFDYSKLDLPEHKVQLRLGSTALQAKNVPLKDGKQGVDVTYIKEGKLHRVRARQSVEEMASAGISTIVTRSAGIADSVAGSMV